MDFDAALRKLINQYWPKTTHPAMAASLLDARGKIANAHAADQGHAYNVFPEENNPDFANPFGGKTDDNDGA